MVTQSTFFNPAPPTVMHVDINSCFATIEQQANPLLRGKPVAVAAYVTGGGCILASSTEAKRLGIKTGMRVRDGQAICPGLVVLPPDPNKYRFVSKKLLALLMTYTPEVKAKSIDEMVMEFKNMEIVNIRNGKNAIRIHMEHTAMEIKQRIRGEIGEWMTVSIGISVNRYLAKIASELHKPDGLDVIDSESIAKILSVMRLEDLTGIKAGYGGRLRSCGITTPIELYGATQKELVYAFRSIVGYQWWMWMHGWETGPNTKIESDQKSFGQSHALFVPYVTTDSKLHQILCQLSGKMARRMREAGFVAGGIHVSALYSDHSFWHHGKLLRRSLFTDRDIFEAARHELLQAPEKPVRLIAVSCFNLIPVGNMQSDLFGEDESKRKVTTAIDEICARWGTETIIPARMLAMERKVLDRISFGKS